MSKIETGGPAFPLHSPDCGTNGGMTLRDYFAAKAMPIILNGFKTSTDKNTAKKVAGLSYAMADAMLEARK